MNQEEILGDLREMSKQFPALHNQYVKLAPLVKAGDSEKLRKKLNHLYGVVMLCRNYDLGALIKKLMQKIPKNLQKLSLNKGRWKLPCQHYELFMSFRVSAP